MYVRRRSNTTIAFRQPGLCRGEPVAHIWLHLYGDIDVVDRYVQFGWNSSPALLGGCTAAVEHAHKRTTFQKAVITPEGRVTPSHARVATPARDEG